MAYRGDVERHRQYCRDYYKNNRDKFTSKAYKAKHAASCKARTKALQQVIDDLKKTGCISCGESHPACLDFHHKKRAGKEISIAVAAHRRWSLKRLMAEVAKCEILCANCHRKLHWKDRRSSKWASG